MERIRALILKLLEQSHSNADASSMMATVQMLQAELAGLPQPAPKQFGSPNVAVVMPSSNRTNHVVRNNIPSQTAGVKPPPEDMIHEDVLEIKKAPVQQQIIAPIEEVREEPLEETVEALPEEQKMAPPPEAAPAEHAGKIPHPGEETTVFNAKLDTNTAHEKYMPQEKVSWILDQPKEVPTPANPNEFREMNDLFGRQASSSLNDKLKSEKAELASVLKEGPVRDLKKAIGVNDRFVFVNELFRGDEPMYERSLKTINNFRIYPEAEYWIERELKVKLGWDENKDAVKQFRHLVKRRFSS